MSRLTLDNYPEILTVSDIKTSLRIGKNKAYNLMSEIRHYQLGRIYYVTKTDLIDYINNK